MRGYTDREANRAAHQKYGPASNVTLGSLPDPTMVKEGDVAVVADGGNLTLTTQKLQSGAWVSQDVNPTWTTYTPTATPNSGAYTYTSQGQYIILNGIIFVNIVVFVSDVNTGSGCLKAFISLPSIGTTGPLASGSGSLFDHTAGSYKALSCTLVQSLHTLEIYMYDGTSPTPGVAGSVYDFYLTAFYQVPFR